MYLQHQRGSKGEKKRKINESPRGGTGRRQCGRGKKSSAAVLEAQSAALFNTFWHCRLSKSLIRRHGVPPPLTKAWRRDGTWAWALLSSTRQRRLAARQTRGKQPTSRAPLAVESPRQRGATRARMVVVVVVVISLTQSESKIVSVNGREQRHSGGGGGGSACCVVRWKGRQDSMRHDDALRCPRLGCSLCKEDASADPRDPSWLDPSLAASLERGDLCKRQSPMQRIEIMDTGPSVVGG